VCRRGRALGFSVAPAIHPQQLPVIAECFMPTRPRSARAQLLDALAQANSVSTVSSSLRADNSSNAIIKGAERVIALSSEASARSRSFADML